MRGLRLTNVVLVLLVAGSARAGVTVLREVTETNAPTESVAPAAPDVPAVPAASATSAPPAVPSAPPPAGTTFASVNRTDAVYRAAIDAHDLDIARRLFGQSSAFKGTVADIFEPESRKFKILNFDPQYSNAVSAVLYSQYAAQFPDLNTLKGKEVLVTGVFTNYRGRAQILLTKRTQIKFVQ